MLIKTTPEYIDKLDADGLLRFMRLQLFHVYTNILKRSDGKYMIHPCLYRNPWAPARLWYKEKPQVVLALTTWVAIGVNDLKFRRGLIPLMDLILDDLCVDHHYRWNRPGVDMDRAQEGRPTLYNDRTFGEDGAGGRIIHDWCVLNIREEKESYLPIEMILDSALQSDIREVYTRNKLKVWIEILMLSFFGKKPEMINSELSFSGLELSEEAIQNLFKK